MTGTETSMEGSGGRKAIRSAWLWAAFAAALAAAVLLSRMPGAPASAGRALNQAIGRGEGMAPVSRDGCPDSHPIKGNVNQSGERTYHVPAGAFYLQTNPEVCFATREGAQAAGFRASRR